MISKIFTAAILLLTVCGGAAFPMSGFTFSGGVSTDYYTGEIREIVYPSSGWTNDYLSELIWEIDNIAMLTGHFTTEYRNLSLNVSAGTAVNKGTGQMDDYDWLDSSTENWTNWSNSDIFMDKSLIFDTSLLYTGSDSDTVSFPIGAGYRLNYMSWTDKAWDYIYKGTWNSDGSFYYYEQPDEGNFGGISAITYMFVQNIFYGTAGISLEKKRFKGEIRGFLSPFIYTWDKDHHILRNTFFIDRFTSGVWRRIECSLGYKTNGSGMFNMSISYEELPETKGDSDYYGEDPADSDELGSYLGTVPSSAGFASKIFRISIGYMYRF